MLLEVRGSGIDVTSQACQQAIGEQFAPIWKKYGQHAVKLHIELQRNEDASVCCMGIAEMSPFGFFEATATSADEIDAIAGAAEQLIHTLASLFGDTLPNQGIQNYFPSDSIRPNMLTSSLSDKAIGA
jgi:hypothetical protein